MSKNQPPLTLAIIIFIGHNIKQVSYVIIGLMDFGDEEVLTLQQAAERLHISPVTLRKQAKNGILRCKLVGHTYLVTASELARYEKEHKGRVGPKPKKESQ